MKKLLFFNFPATHSYFRPSRVEFGQLEGRLGRARGGTLFIVMVAILTLSLLSGHFRSSGTFPQTAQKNATKHMILPVHCAASAIYPTLRLPNE